VFGPAKEWISCELQPNIIKQLPDSTYLELTAIHKSNPSLNFNISTIFNPEPNLVNIDLSNVNAVDYPFYKNET
jgi:hypothetical protein